MRDSSWSLFPISSANGFKNAAGSYKTKQNNFCIRAPSLHSSVLLHVSVCWRSESPSHHSLHNISLYIIMHLLKLKCHPTLAEAKQSFATEYLNQVCHQNQHQLQKSAVQPLVQLTIQSSVHPSTQLVVWPPIYLSMGVCGYIMALTRAGGFITAWWTTAREFSSLHSRTWLPSSPLFWHTRLCNQ